MWFSVPGVEKATDRTRRVVIGLFDEVRVDVQCGRGVGVAEAAAHGSDVGAARKQVGGVEVSKVV
jgi:hypothetical protein